MKKVKKLKMQPYCATNILGKRAYSNVGELATTFLAKRMKKFVASDFEVVEYDKDLMEK